MDLESFVFQLPVIYTTRLEEMAVLRKDVRKTTPKEVIKAIIAESKPCYNFTTFGKGYSTLYKCDNRTQYKQSSLKTKLSFEELQSKVKQISNKINSEDEEAIKCEIKTNSYSSQKINRLIAMCKPLKIVLEDINKIERKPNIKINKKHCLNISSDSDDDVILTEQRKKRNVLSNNKNSSSIDSRGPEVSHVIRNITDFKNILNTEILQNCVIVIYNVYLEEIDAYHIDKKRRVTEYQTWKYVEVSKFPMKACKTVYNIIVCCWQNRESYVRLLLEYKKYNKITANMIKRVHLCTRRCTCCCFFKTSPKADVNVESEEILHSSPAKKGKFIETALKYQRTTKWQEQPDTTSDTHKVNKPKYKRCTQLFQIDNANGNIEFYEMGRDNVVYSKLNIHKDKCCSWRASTVGRPRFHSKLTCTDPENREEEIINYNNKKMVMPFNTECFLRKPMKLSAGDVKNMPRYCPEPLSSSLVDTIEHSTSLVGAGKKLSLSSKKCRTKGNISSLSQLLHSNRCSKPADQSQSLLQMESQLVPETESVTIGRKSSKPPKPVIEEPSTSETINCLIRDILHRFRNVLLTINADGKVAAALNAPLNSLSSAELNILSQILSHAQTQVDKLGLKPGTCLNPDGSTVPQSNPNNVNASSSDTNNFTENSEHLTEAINSPNKNEETKNAYLKHFSKIICQKKMDYQKSFHSFLCNIVEPTPKITHVFSLSQTDCFTLDNQKSTLEGDDSINAADDMVSVKEEIVDQPKMLMDTCINECKADINFLDNEIEALASRKRKSLLNSTTTPPKIRVKKIEEVIDDDLRSIELVPPNLVKTPEPGSLNSDSTPNHSDNFRLRDLLLSQPKKMQHLPLSPLASLKPTVTFYEVTPHGEITAHKAMPKV